MTGTRSQQRGLFVTGTDTGVGKTYVTALIARELLAAGHSVGVHKPVCTGSETGSDGEPLWSDVETLFQAVDGEFPRERICPQRFRAPLAPPVAARLEGACVDSVRLRSGADWWAERVEYLLVEGVGGLLCPLTERETVADLAADLRLPLLIVARWGLGTINHTLLTVEAAQRRGLAIAGVLLNESVPVAGDVSTRSNADEIAARTEAPVLGVLEHNQSGGLLRGADRIRMDWAALASPHSWSPP